MRVTRRCAWYLCAAGSLLRRVCATNAVVEGTSELVVALLLLYQRLLERRLGTAKYAGFVAFVLLATWPARLWRRAAAAAHGRGCVVFACNGAMLLREVPGAPPRSAALATHGRR